MKINIFDNIKKLFKEDNTVTLVKDKDYVDCFIYEDFSCNMIQRYLYVVDEGYNGYLYTYPDLVLLDGKDAFTFEYLKNIKCDKILNRDTLSRNTGFSHQFYNSFDNFKNNFSKNKEVSNTIGYLQSKYFTENDKYKEDYLQLYEYIKNECDKNNIKYETDSDKIIKDMIDNYQNKDKYFDLSMCTSKSNIDKYIEERLKEENNSYTLSSDLNYTKTAFNSGIISDYLGCSYYLNDLFNRKQLFNKNEVLKRYMEFFIASDKLFEISNYLDEQADSINDRYINDKLDKLYEDVDFIDDLEGIMEHDKDKYIYRYHATTSIDSAENIMNDGFYMYSDDLESTTFPELSLDQVLIYEYGNGFNNYGDQIIIIRDKKDENIVKELSEEEQNLINIDPRRMGLVGVKPSYKVDIDNIVGYIDKNKKKVYKNSKLINENNKIK